eukprot:1944149-Amphidinium_carterae.1
MAIHLHTGRHLRVLFSNRHGSVTPSPLAGARSVEIKDAVLHVGGRGDRWSGKFYTNSSVFDFGNEITMHGKQLF